ncbi:hypothetical protein SHIRM173S_02994 [Streptomyces hirsutus]
MPTFSTRPCASRNTSSAGLPKEAITWPASISRCRQREASSESTSSSSYDRRAGSSPSSAGMTSTRSPVFTNVTRPSPTAYVSRRFTRYVPPCTSTQGSMRSSQRELISCICGTDLVVVARFRAAAVPRLCCCRVCSVRTSSPTDIKNCPPSCDRRPSVPGVGLRGKAFLTERVRGITRMSGNGLQPVLGISWGFRSAAVPWSNIVRIGPHRDRTMGCVRSAQVQAPIEAVATGSRRAARRRRGPWPHPCPRVRS